MEERVHGCQERNVVRATSERAQPCSPALGGPTTVQPAAPPSVQTGLLFGAAPNLSYTPTQPWARPEQIMPRSTALLVRVQRCLAQEDLRIVSYEHVHICMILAMGVCSVRVCRPHSGLLRRCVSGLGGAEVWNLKISLLPARPLANQAIYVSPTFLDCEWR